MTRLPRIRGRFDTATCTEAFGSNLVSPASPLTDSQQRRHSSGKSETFGCYGRRNACPLPPSAVQAPAGDTIPVGVSVYESDVAGVPRCATTAPRSGPPPDENVCDHIPAAKGGTQPSPSC